MFNNIIKEKHPIVIQFNHQKLKIRANSQGERCLYSTILNRLFTLVHKGIKRVNRVDIQIAMNVYKYKLRIYKYSIKSKLALMKYN